MTKAKLIYLGWTPDNLRERMQGCRDGLREAYATNGPALWTYRAMFTNLYRQYKYWLKLIS